MSISVFGRHFHTGHLVVLLGLIAGTVIVLFPLIWMLSYSLRPNSELALSSDIIPRTFTIESYERVFADPRFPTVIRNSLVVATVASVITLAFAAPTAYVLARFRFRGRALIAGSFVYVLVVPAITLIVPLFLLARQLGLYDNLAGLVIIYAGLNTPFITLLLIAFFAQVPPDMEEAAQVDGATRWGAFLHVALPLARPGLIAGVLIAFLAVWEEYLIVLTLAPSAQNQTIPVGLGYFSQQYTTDYAGLMAASVVSSIPALLVFLLMGRFIIRGITTGGVKG